MMQRAVRKRGPQQKVGSLCTFCLISVVPHFANPAPQKERMKNAVVGAQGRHDGVFMASTVNVLICLYKGMLAWDCPHRPDDKKQR